MLSGTGLRTLCRSPTFCFLVCLPNGLFAVWCNDFYHEGCTANNAVKTVAAKSGDVNVKTARMWVLSGWVAGADIDQCSETIAGAKPP